MRRPYWATRYNLIEVGKVALIVGAVLVIGFIISTWVAP